ncbi:MAG: hypothetical protein RL701_5320, partial [Pseudomonadota bacterium]
RALQLIGAHPAWASVLENVRAQAAQAQRQ